MIKHLFAFACLALTLNACGPVYVVHQDPPPQAAPAPPPPEGVTYQSFYDQLSPYGQWIDYPGYGNVWQPNVDPDFKPYATNGHWVYSDAGWVWASDYSWGWATFHYGRWFYEDGYGWMWIPGHEWAPAWVSWRRSPDYYGWAPLGPNISISVSIGGGYNPPAHYWNFVPQQYVTSPHINNYYVDDQKNVTIINKTTIINNTTVVNNNVTNNVTNNNTTNNVNNNITNNRVTNNVTNNYAGGPDPQEVERVTGAPLKPVILQTRNTPGPSSANGNGQLTIYRPRVNAAPAAGSGTGGIQPKPAPARVIPFSQARPVNTMHYDNNSNNANAANNPGAGHGADIVAPPQGRPSPVPGGMAMPPPAVTHPPVITPPAGNMHPALNTVPPPVTPPVGNPPHGATVNGNTPHGVPPGGMPPHRDSTRIKPNGKPLKPVVKPTPPAHPGDDTLKDKDKDKDKKED